MRDRASPRRADRAKLVLDLVCEPHQVARAIAQQASRVGEFDAEAVADEEARIQLCLERLERLGERRLSQVTRLSGIMTFPMPSPRSSSGFKPSHSKARGCVRALPRRR